MQYHSEDKDDILSGFKTNPETGLTGDQAQQRLIEHGENKLEEKRKRPSCSAF